MPHNSKTTGNHASELKTRQEIMPLNSKTSGNHASEFKHVRKSCLRIKKRQEITTGPQENTIKLMEYDAKAVAKNI